MTNSRSSCVARARLTSRVVPAMALTIARPRPAIRLKMVDLPTFARPTSTSPGRPPALLATTLGPAAGLGLTRVVIVSFQFHLQSEFFEAARIARPSALDLDAQGEEQVAAE